MRSESPRCHQTAGSPREAGKIRETTGFGTGGTQLDKETHPSGLWSWSLALGAGWSFQSGILGLLAPSPIKRDNVLPADASLTHGALLPVWPCLQPLKRKHKVCSNTKRVFKVPSPFRFPVHLMSALPDEDRANWIEEKEEKTGQTAAEPPAPDRSALHRSSQVLSALLLCFFPEFLQLPANLLT